MLLCTLEAVESGLFLLEMLDVLEAVAGGLSCGGFEISSGSATKYAAMGSTSKESPPMADTHSMVRVLHCEMFSHSFRKVFYHEIITFIHTQTPPFKPLLQSSTMQIDSHPIFQKPSTRK